MLSRTTLPAALLLASFAPAVTAQAPTVAPGWPVTLGGNAVSSVLLVDLDGDPELEILQVTGSAASGSALVAHNPDGSVVPGWPKATSYGTFSAPAAGDIDGDGDREVVVASFYFGIYGDLYAFHHDGTPVSGFPLSYGGPMKGPSLGDVDGDGDLEIAQCFNASGVGGLYVFQGDGSLVPGWPRPFSSVVGSAPSIGDVDGDGDAEVFAPSFERIHGFEGNGTPLPGFPLNPPQQFINYSSITLADLDADGDRELVFATGDNFVDNPGKVWVAHHDGTLATGWPKTTDFTVYSPPAVADVDGDGSLDVVVGTNLLSPLPINRLYAWDAAGNDLPGFPLGNEDSFNQQVTIADIDGDGMVELLHEVNVAGTDYLAKNHDGTDVPGWPLLSQSLSSFNQQLSVGDLDADGLLELAGTVEELGTGNSRLYVWDTTTPWVPDLAPVPTHMYGHTRGGVAGAPGEAQVVAYGCDVGATGSLEVLVGSPVPGGVMTLGVSNPSGSQGPGAVLLAVAGAPDPAYPCGTPIPGAGMGGGDGELLVSVAPQPLLLGPLPYAGAGTTTAVPAGVPAGPAFVGLRLYVQGFVVDLSGFTVTSGLDLRIGA